MSVWLAVSYVCPDSQINVDVAFRLLLEAELAIVLLPSCTVATEVLILALVVVSYTLSLAIALLIVTFALAMLAVVLVGTLTMV